MKYRDGRYHRSICWCKEFDCQLLYATNSITSLKLSSHVFDKMYTAKERSYNIEKINLDSIFSGEVIEVYILNSNIDKYLVRFPYDCDFDMMGVFSPQQSELVCVTLWQVPKTYSHDNLNYDLYVNRMPKTEVVISTSTIASRFGTSLFQKLMNIATQ